MERERAGERSRTQLELDWQRRFEEKESNQYEKSEDLIKKLTKSRDEVIRGDLSGRISCLIPPLSFLECFFLLLLVFFKTFILLSLSK